MSETAVNVLAWAVPAVEGPILGQRRITDLTALEREAWDHGFAEGRSAAQAAMREQQQRQHAELTARAARLDAILELLAQPLAQLDVEVVQQLAQLAGAVARQLVRRELKNQPEQIVAVIRDTIALLPAGARATRIIMHPDDAALVRELLVEPASERAWTLSEDPVVTRGGCRVVSDSSSIDAQVESRLGAAIAAALGDERSPTGDPQ